MNLNVIDGALAAAFRDLMVERVDSSEDLAAIQMSYHDDTEVEPLTRHAFMGRRLVLNSTGYGTYSWSDLQMSKIGRYCSIAGNVRLLGPDHPTDFATTHPMAFGPTYRALMQQNGFPDWNAVMPHRVKKASVTIGHDVWIGRDAVLGRGITIGNGAIVAAGAVVTKDVAPYTIVGGIPAKVIRKRFDAPLERDLQALGWWNYRMSDFGDQKFRNVPAFIKAFTAKQHDLPPLPDLRLKVSDLLAGTATLPARADWL